MDSKTLWPKGIKKTKQRAEVLDALCEAGRPVNAQEISAMLENRGSQMWFSTIYRVLDTFLEHGTIRRADVDKDGMAMYELNDGHRHYAVCVGCRKIIEIHGCPLESFMPDLQDKSFHVVGHKLQISGFCGDCHGQGEPKA